MNLWAEQAFRQGVPDGWGRGEGSGFDMLVHTRVRQSCISPEGRGACLLPSEAGSKELMHTPPQDGP